MLPMLRILPVGGVFLAIMLLVLALNPPAGHAYAIDAERWADARRDDRAR
jgi:hypothetical protein